MDLLGVIKIKLIINADDFGYSKAVNYGIIEGHKDGIVTSTTLITNMPDAEHAVSLCKESPNLGVGIHLVLTAGKPVNKDVPSLVDEKGYFKRKYNKKENINLEDVRKEFKSQMERFLSFGFMPTHIDSHHHIHFNSNILPIIVDIAREYDLPIRFTKEKLNNKGYKDVKSVEYFTDEFYGRNLSLEKFENILKNNERYKSMDIMCHPGYLDQNLMLDSSYNIERTNELEILTNPEIFEIIEKYNINLINYKEL